MADFASDEVEGTRTFQAFGSQAYKSSPSCYQDQHSNIPAPYLPVGTSSFSIQDSVTKRSIFNTPAEYSIGSKSAPSQGSWRGRGYLPPKSFGGPASRNPVYSSERDCSQGVARGGRGRGGNRGASERVGFRSPGTSVGFRDEGISGGFRDTAKSEGYSGGVVGGFRGSGISGGFRDGGISGGFHSSEISGGFRDGGISGGFRDGGISGGFRSGVISGGFRDGGISGGFRDGVASGRLRDDGTTRELRDSEKPRAYTDSRFGGGFRDSGVRRGFHDGGSSRGWGGNRDSGVRASGTRDHDAGRHSGNSSGSFGVDTRGGHSMSRGARGKGFNRGGFSAPFLGDKVTASDKFHSRPWQPEKSVSLSSPTRPPVAGFKRPASASLSNKPPPVKKRPEASESFVMPDEAPENFKKIVIKRRCDLCPASLNSIVTAEVHYNGKQHQRMLRESGLPSGEYFSGVLGVTPSTGGPSDSGGLEQALDDIESRYCKLCDVTFTNPVQMFQHYAGKKHKINTRDMAKVAEASIANTKVFRCEVCNIFTNTQESLDSHLAGSKHKASLEAATSGDVKAGGGASGNEIKGVGDTDVSKDKTSGNGLGEICAALSSSANDASTKQPSPPSQPTLSTPPSQRPAVGSTRSSAPAEWPFKCIACVIIFDCQEALTAHNSSLEHSAKVAAMEQAVSPPQQQGATTRSMSNTRRF